LRIGNYENSVVYNEFMSEIIEKGMVLSQGGSRVEVKILPEGECDSTCPLKSACRKKDLVVDAENVVNANQGDEVKVKIETSYYYNALFLIFILPLILMIGGYFLGSNIFQSENVGYIFTVLSLLIWLLVLRFTSKFYKPYYRIIEILRRSQNG